MICRSTSLRKQTRPGLAGVFGSWGLHRRSAAFSSMVFDYNFRLEIGLSNRGRVSVIWHCLHCINVNCRLIIVNAQAMPNGLVSRKTLKINILDILRPCLTKRRKFARPKIRCFLFPQASKVGRWRAVMESSADSRSLDVKHSSLPRRRRRACHSLETDHAMLTLLKVSGGLPL